MPQCPRSANLGYIWGPPGDNCNHQEASKKEPNLCRSLWELLAIIKLTWEDRSCVWNFVFLGFRGLFGWVRRGVVQMHFPPFFFASQGCGPFLHFFFAFFFFAFVLPSVFLFSGKPWTDVYHVVLQMLLLLILTIPQAFLSKVGKRAVVHIDNVMSKHPDQWQFYKQFRILNPTNLGDKHDMQKFTHLHFPIDN